MCRNNNKEQMSTMYPARERIRCLNQTPKLDAQIRRLNQTPKLDAQIRRPNQTYKLDAQMVPNGPKQFRKGPEWSPNSPYGPKLSQMVPNIPKRSQMVPYMGISKTHKFLKCVCVCPATICSSARPPARQGYIWVHMGYIQGTYGLHMGVNMGIYGYIWVYMGPYGYMWVHMDIQGYIWVHKTYAWVYMGIYRHDRALKIDFWLRLRPKQPPKVSFWHF